MVLLNYKDFLMNQCANCSLFLTTENIKLTYIKNLHSSSPLSKSDHPNEISNTDAISYVYGLSTRYLTEKLKSYFIEQNYECEQENTSEESDKSENMEPTTVLVLCEKCGSVFEDLYKVSKLFRNLSDKSSLIWKILEERGFEANIDENRSDVDIKTEDDDIDALAVSNEEDLNLSHWNESENSDSNSENEYKDVKITGAGEDENLNSEDPDSCEKDFSTSIKKRLRKQNLEPRKRRKCVEKFDGIPKDKDALAKNCKGDSADEKDENEDYPEESLNGDCSDDDFSPPMSDASEQSDQEFSLNSKGKKRKGNDNSRRRRINYLRLREHYDKIVWEGESCSETVKYKFSCKECSGNFHSRSLFHRHYLEKHFEGAGVHLEEIPGPPFQCPKCEMSYKGYANLERHCARRHHLKIASKKKKHDQQDLLKCVECDTFYDSWQGFRTHQKRQHGTKYYKCSLCTEIFPLEQDLKEHKMSHHNHRYRILKKASNNNAGSSKDDDNEEDPPLIPINYSQELYFCRSCNFKFYTRFSLVNHLRTSHDGIHKYDCKICDASFEYLFALLNHLAEVHKEYARPGEYVDLYTCTEGDGVCMKSFYRRHFLSKHQKQSKHSAFKVMCAFCEESFTESKALTSHKLENHQKRIRLAQTSSKSNGNSNKLSDGGETSNIFKCWFCEETFDNKKDELNHRASHPKEEQIFRCQECNLSFSKYHQLSNHNIRHRDDICKDYQCEKCGRKLNGARQYRLHCRMHDERASGVRPVCELCGKTYSTTRMLNKHKNIMHFRKEERTCHLCPYVSKTLYNLKIHLKVHEKNGILRLRKKKLE